MCIDRLTCNGRSRTVLKDHFNYAHMFNKDRKLTKFGRCMTIRRRRNMSLYEKLT